MARYTLKAYDNNQHYEIDIPLNEKYKTRLQTIDAYFMNNGIGKFRNKSEYIAYFNETNKENIQLTANSVFYITYNANHKECKFPVVFGNNAVLGYFSYVFTEILSKFDDVQKTVNKEDEILKTIESFQVWRDFKNNFLNRVLNKNFRKYLFSKMNSYDSTNIDEYVKSISGSGSEAQAIAINNMSIMLANYRGLRITILALQEYSLANNWDNGLDSGLYSHKLEELVNIMNSKKNKSEQVQKVSYEDRHYGPDDKDISISDTYSDADVKEMFNSEMYREYLSEIGEESVNEELRKNDEKRVGR